LIAENLGDEMKKVSLGLPYSKAQLLDWFHENGKVLTEEYKGDKIYLEGQLEQHLLMELRSKLTDGELEEVN